MVSFLRRLPAVLSAHAETAQKFCRSSISMTVAARLDGTVEALSPSARTAFGIFDDPIGLSVSDLLIGSPFSRLRSSDGPVKVLAARRDGTVFGATVRRTRVRAGLSRRDIFLITDEASRLDAEHREHEATTLLAAMMNAITDPVLVCDAGGCFTCLNDAASRLAGIPGTLLLGQPSSSPALPFALRDLLTQVRKENRTVERELHMDGPAGRQCMKASSFVLGDGTGGHRGTITIIRDVTQERADAAALAAARDRAERAVLEKTRFLCSVSHDLLQPVQAMCLQMEVLLNCELPDRSTAAVQRLTRSVTAMKSLLDGLMDLRQLDAGCTSMHPQAMGLGPIFQALRTEFVPLARAKGLSLCIGKPPCEQVVSDPARLAQMLHNLVSNAVRYTHAGSVELHHSTHADRLVIEVRDTGIGIPAAQIAHIWDDFVQLGNSARRRSEGIGLGLSIVARLSRLLSHPVEVKSTPGEGSSFYLTLPLAQAAAQRMAYADPASPRPERRTALVVDDDHMVLTGIDAYLNQAGYSVVTADSADAAICKLDQAGCSPDLIIADYCLQNSQTGVDAIATLRRHVGRAVPAAVLTAQMDKEVDDSIRSVGLLLLRKPLDGKSMVQSLEAFCSIDA